MSKVVLDASALLAYLFNETGASRVQEVLHGSLLSSVNLAEVVAKVIDKGAGLEEAARQIARLPIQVVAFDREQGYLTASLRKETTHKGLSLGDRACLALGLQSSATVLTADATWETLTIPVAIHLIR